MATPTSMYPRLIEPALHAALQRTPVVCLLGPRQSGKTTLAQRLAPGRAFYDLDQRTIRETASMDPDGFIASLPEAVTLDEIQRAPDLLPAIKIAADRKRRPGRFLLTGSANIHLLPRITESLVGRMEVVELQPLSEAEKNRSSGRFLQHLLQGGFQPRIVPESATARLDLAKRLVAGGYPEPLARSSANARQWHRQYVRNIIERDVREVANVRDADNLSRLLQSLAQQNAQVLNFSRLADALQLDVRTIKHHLSILERLYLVRRLPPWHRDASKRLSRPSKAYVLDSGLAAMLARLTVDDWLNRRALMGHLLESFVVQQLIAQAAWTDLDLDFWHYREQDRTEVDLVISRGPETWGIEVKAAATVSPGDGRSLRRLAEVCGKHFRQGLLLYDGQESIYPMGDPRILAVPLAKLWTL